jgi:hypothetical protein
MFTNFPKKIRQKTGAPIPDDFLLPRGNIFRILTE